MKLMKEEDFAFDCSLPLPPVADYEDKMLSYRRETGLYYHGLSRFLKSWTIGTKDHDSVTSYCPVKSLCLKRH